MPTLLLRLEGPMQAWGTLASPEHRPTNKVPTKSGVIGLIASALGMDRDDDISALSSLRFGTRADQPGYTIPGKGDFHTAQSIEGETYVASYDYLSGAIFLAGLESDDINLLSEIQTALKFPRRLLYLGRKCCPPSAPIAMGIRSGSLSDVLDTEPWIGRDPRVDRERILVCLENGKGAVSRRVHDQPISFSSICKQYGFRSVAEHYVSLDTVDDTCFDPFSELE